MRAKFLRLIPTRVCSFFALHLGFQLLCPALTFSPPVLTHEQTILRLFRDIVFHLRILLPSCFPSDSPIFHFYVNSLHLTVYQTYYSQTSTNELLIGRMRMEMAKGD